MPLTAVEWTAAPLPGFVVGWADIRLPGGVEIRDLRISRDGDGFRVGLARVAAVRGEDVARMPGGAIRFTRPICIPDPEDFSAFSAAVIEALRVAFPEALGGARSGFGVAASSDQSIPSTPPAAILAAAIGEPE